MSCCEKMHKVAFGRLNGKKKLDAPSPSSTTAYSTHKAHVSSIPIRPEGKASKKFVHFSSSDVDNNGDEDKYSSYIDGVKMKMRAPSDVPRSDSFNDKVSSFISRARRKLVATTSMVPGAKNPAP